MPFLIEYYSEDEPKGWIPWLLAGPEQIKHFNDSDSKFRVRQLDQARIDYLLAKGRADRAFAHYLDMHRIAYDLMIRIRPDHWPEDMKP